MVGDFSVGKTSLTQKFVNNVFSEKYLTTIGVKIDTVDVDDVKLVVWDVAGRDSLSPINVSYLVGAAGIVFVADGTREDTLKSLPELSGGDLAMELTCERKQNAEDHANPNGPERQRKE